MAITWLPDYPLANNEEKYGMLVGATCRSNEHSVFFFVIL
jgi:hypothetical protein